MFQIVLKSLRENQKLSQRELAERLGIAQSTVGMWESGKREPDYKTLNTLAKYFNVTLDYLIGSDIRFKPEEELKGIKIPVLGYVRAGIPLDAVEEILDYEEISQAMASKGEYFALSIKGDSMEPRIKEGDVVIVRKQSVVENGEVAVVLVNGNDATVKKFVKHEDGVSLIGFNPSFTPLFYTKNEVATLPVEVIGKVVELRGKFE